jgi:hypothetical protein
MPYGVVFFIDGTFAISHNVGVDLGDMGEEVFVVYVNSIPYTKDNPHVEVLEVFDTYAEAFAFAKGEPEEGE